MISNLSSPTENQEDVEAGPVTTENKEKVKNLAKSTRRPATAKDAQANNGVAGDDGDLYPRVHKTAGNERHGFEYHCNRTVARGKYLLEMEGAFDRPQNRALYHTRQQVVRRCHQESEDADDTLGWFRYVRHMESKTLSDAMRAYKARKSQADQEWIEQQRKAGDMFGKLRRFESAVFLTEHDANAAAGVFEYYFDYTYGDYYTSVGGVTANGSSAVKQSKGKKSSYQKIKAKTESGNDDIESGEETPRGRRRAGRNVAAIRRHYPEDAEADGYCNAPEGYATDHEEDEPRVKRRRNHNPSMPHEPASGRGERDLANLARRPGFDRDSLRFLAGRLRITATWNASGIGRDYGAIDTTAGSDSGLYSIATYNGTEQAGMPNPQMHSGPQSGPASWSSTAASHGGLGYAIALQDAHSVPQYATHQYDDGTLSHFMGFPGPNSPLACMPPPIVYGTSQSTLFNTPASDAPYYYWTRNHCGAQSSPYGQYSHTSYQQYSSTLGQWNTNTQAPAPAPPARNRRRQAPVNNGPQPGASSETNNGA